MKFKPGDKVICNYDYGKEDNGLVPIVGKVYTIELYRNGEFPMLIEIQGTGRYWDDANFELVNDIINKPAHYTQGKIEVIDFIEDQKLDFRAANVVKYTCRARYKGKELEDYKKARFYLDRLIQEMEQNDQTRT